MGRRPVRSLSACTVELYLYSPYGPQACTEPQCLYMGALYVCPFTYLMLPIAGKDEVKREVVAYFHVLLQGGVTSVENASSRLALA